MRLDCSYSHCFATCSLTLPLFSLLRDTSVPCLTLSKNLYHWCIFRLHRCGDMYTWPYKDIVWYVGCGCINVAHVRREEDYTRVTDRIFFTIINWIRDALANRVRRGIALNPSLYDRSVEATSSPFHHRSPVASEANAAAQSLKFAIVGWIVDCCTVRSWIYKCSAIYSSSSLQLIRRNNHSWATDALNNC